MTKIEAAMRLLAGLALQAGGEIRVAQAVCDGIDASYDLQCEPDPETGDVVIRVKKCGHRTKGGGPAE